MRRVYIVTVWNVGDVYVGGSAKKAEAAHNEAVFQIIDEAWGWSRYDGDFPVCTWRNGELLRSSEGPKKYE